jgi:hypothetical protein
LLLPLSSRNIWRYQSGNQKPQIKHKQVFRLNRCLWINASFIPLASSPHYIDDAVQQKYNLKSYKLQGIWMWNVNSKINQHINVLQNKNDVIVYYQITTSIWPDNNGSHYIAMEVNRQLWKSLGNYGSHWVTMEVIR